MKKLYLITGNQDLYGDETLAQVAEDSRQMADFLSEALAPVSVEWLPTVTTHEEANDTIDKANTNKDCIGVILWMYTFSPAKMWITALKALNKPMLHLHTQFNKKLPYDSIDMDIMNLNQSAHDDREFDFMCSRLGIKREVVAGYYKHEQTMAQLRRFAEVCRAVDYSKGLKVAMFGNNMRDVAVTANTIFSMPLRPSVHRENTCRSSLNRLRTASSTIISTRKYSV